MMQEILSSQDGGESGPQIEALLINERNLQEQIIMLRQDLEQARDFAAGMELEVYQIPSRSFDPFQVTTQAASRFVAAHLP